MYTALSSCSSTIDKIPLRDTCYAEGISEDNHWQILKLTTGVFIHLYVCVQI